MKIEIVEAPERLTVALIGDLDSCAAQELDAQFEQLVPLVPAELTVDLGQLEVPCVLRKPVSPEELVRVVRECLTTGAAKANL